MWKRPKSTFALVAAISFLVVGCGGGGGNTRSSCTTNKYKFCYDNDIYWYDSCGKQEAKAEECGIGNCYNGQCIKNPMIVAGGNTSCAIISNDIVKCWGDNSYAQLGQGSTSDYEAIPVSLSISPGISKIAFAETHSCAVLFDGTVKCWGDNGQGQLGYEPSIVGSYIPVAVNGLSSVSQVVAGYYHTCALLLDKTAKCWGYGGDGQLGDGIGYNSSATPVDVVNLVEANYISAGDRQNCALLLSGSAKCWGKNENGQLGDGTRTNRTSPTEVINLSNVAHIDNSGVHTCALTKSGAVKCWGQNAYGQLGDGTANSSNSPVDVLELSNATQIAIGINHSCALLSSGAVKCWGKGGLTGDGTNERRTSPVDVVDLSYVSQIDVGIRHTCALLYDTSVKCWGLNDNGQLGDGTTENRLSPVSVVGF